MSAYRRKTDLAQVGAEGRSLTQMRHSLADTDRPPSPSVGKPERRLTATFLTRSGRISDHTITRLDELMPLRYAQT